jgi:hypothetical protein
VAQDFIGGSGITVKYLYDEVAPDCDPLGPENKLIYAPGPITGSTIPCASRMAINAKSPATGAMGVATTGGHFPVEMKRAGYDVIIIEGKAAEPTYLSTALRLAAAFKFPSAYDAFYLALAERLNAELWTADTRLCSKVGTGGPAVRLITAVWD